MNAQDRQLLDRLQTKLPLVSRPFAAIGEELGMGEPLSTVRNRLVATLRLEEAREARKSMTPTYYMLGALAFMAILAALIGYYMLKTRK